MIRRLRVALVLLALAGLALPATPAGAAEFRTGESVVVPAGELVDDDLYVAGGTVTVDGTITGDVVAAGGTVNILGTVGGDVLAAGGTVNILGQVSGSVRVAGGTVRVLASVGGDLLAFTGNLEVGPSAAVGRDVVSGAGTILLRGSVTRDARLSGETVTLAGTVGRDVHAQVGQRLELTSTASVQGDLRYTSSRQAAIAQGATVAGTVTHTPSRTSILGIDLRETLLTRILGALVRQAQVFLSLVIVGLLLLWLAPRSFIGAAELLATAPWQSLGMGLLALVATPAVVLAAAGVAFFLAGPGAFSVLVVPAALYVGLLGLVGPVVALLLGALLLRRFNLGEEPAAWQALLLGSALLALPGLAPVLDIVAAVLTVVFGFGAWALLLWRAYIRARQANAI